MVDAWRRLPISECGPMPYLWLIYAAAVPVSLWGSGAPARIVALQLVVLFVFLVLYIGGYGRRGKSLWLSPARWLSSARSHRRAMPPPQPISSMARPSRGAFSSRTAYRVLAGYVPLLALYVWLMHVNLYGAVPAVIFSLVVGIASISAAEEKRAHARLQQAHDQIERFAKIAERERIARDLHDVLGHTLSLIALKSQLASKLAERDPQRAADEIRAVEQIARTSLDELREALWHDSDIPDRLT